MAMSADERRVSYHVTLDAEMKSQNDYFLLPVTVPDGTAALQIRYEYDQGKVGDPNVIDLGLLGPGDTEFLKVGSFRGWSGSNKKEIRVSSDRATPGYYPGILESGKWNVMLGLYKISREGCPCTVEIAVERGSGRSLSRTASLEHVPSRSTDDGLHWLRGDLHTHTHHSDGSLSVAGLAQEAKRRRLDFIAITDHNTTSQCQEISAELSSGAITDLTIIPGEELTSYHGHANIWNTAEWLDFRIRSEKDAKAAIGEAHRKKLLFSINHPNDLGPWDYKGATEFDCIEVWSGLWFRMNFQSVDWWDDLARKGARKVPVGGSDFHSPEEGEARDLLSVGTPTTWVLSRGRSPSSIVDGIRLGRTFISRGPEGPFLLLKAETGEGEHQVGSEIRTRAGKGIAFEVEVRGGKGLGLRLVANARCVSAAPVDSSDYSHVFRQEVDNDQFVRGELVEKDAGWESASTQELEMAALTDDLNIKVLP